MRVGTKRIQERKIQVNTPKHFLATYRGYEIDIKHEGKADCGEEVYFISVTNQSTGHLAYMGWWRDLRTDMMDAIKYAFRRAEL